MREVVEEVEEGITAQLADVATELNLPVPPVAAPPKAPEISAPPLKSRRQETQLMMILGAGFGLGVALVVTRLFAGLAPGMTVAGLVVGGLVGLVLTVWVVGIRGLLHDRGVLDRWVSDVINVVRSAVEERVATRVLVAETALTSELAHRDEVESATAAESGRRDRRRIARACGRDGPRGEGPGPSAAAPAASDRRRPGALIWKEPIS